MTLHQNAFGVDLSYDWLDVQSRRRNTYRRIPNTPEAIAAFVTELLAEPITPFVVFEATSGCDHELRQQLNAAGILFHRINPRQAREFARGTGKYAKTDKVDARVLAEIAYRLDLAPTVEPSQVRKDLSELVTRRDQLVEEIVREKNRLTQAKHAGVRKDIASHIRLLEDRKDKFEAAITEHVRASSELRDDAERLQQVPGIGAVVSATLLAELPELGHRDRRAIASLAGLAPLASDSGRHRGARRIWGGRRKARRALFIAALHASRRCRHWAALRARMLAGGKPKKVVLITIARHILVALNAMLRDRTDFRPPAV